MEHAFRKLYIPPLGPLDDPPGVIYLDGKLTEKTVDVGVLNSIGEDVKEAREELFNLGTKRRVLVEEIRTQKRRVRKWASTGTQYSWQTLHFTISCIHHHPTLVLTMISSALYCRIFSCLYERNQGTNHFRSGALAVGHATVFPSCFSRKMVYWGLRVDGKPTG